MVSSFQLCTIINKGWGRQVLRRLRHKPKEDVQHFSSVDGSKAFALVSLKCFQRPNGATQEIRPGLGMTGCHLNACEEHHKAVPSHNGGPCAKPGGAPRRSDQLHLLGIPYFWLFMLLKSSFFPNQGLELVLGLLM